MDDLTKHWNCLSLSEREGDDLCIKKDRRSQAYIIAALFLTCRALNTEAVARTSHFGGPRGVSKFREKETINFSSFLTIKKM